MGEWILNMRRGVGDIISREGVWRFWVCFGGWCLRYYMYGRISDICDATVIPGQAVKYIQASICLEYRPGDVKKPSRIPTGVARRICVPKFRAGCLINGVLLG